MAITRAQQAKQMLQDGGRIGLKPGGPPGGGATSMGSGRDFSSGAVDTGDLGSEAANVAANQAARDYSDSSPVDTGDLGTEAANVAALRDANRFRDDNRIAKAFSLLNPFSKERQKLAYKLSMKLPGQEKRSAKYQKAYRDYLKSLGITEEDLEGELPSADFFVDKGFIDKPKPEDAMLPEPMSYGDFLLKEFNNPTVKYRGDIGRYRREMGLDDGDSPLLFPRSGIMAQAPEEKEKEEDEDPINFRLLAKGGMADPVVGGEFDFESARQMYGLGKLVKKITRSVKKIAKSPIGKLALGAAAFKFGPAFLSGQGFNLGTAKKFSDLKFLGEGANVNMFRAIGIPSILSGLMTKQDENNEEQQYTGADFPNPVDFYLSGKAPLNTRLAAEGGLMRIGYQEGSKEPVAKKTMPLLDMGGMEKDYREEGGFVPIGRMEKADDVPARLSKNEFVFTADAVRNAGDGDVDLGAEKMYNMMKNLEAGGDVSEESQGLKGAREMFQTSQRLEEVI